MFQPGPQPSGDDVTDDVAASWGSIPQFWIARCTSCMGTTSFVCLLSNSIALLSSAQKSEGLEFTSTRLLHLFAASVLLFIGI